MSSITIEPALWPTSALIDWWSLLHRIAKRPDPARLAEVEQLLRARLNLGGTSLGFSTEDSDRALLVDERPRRERGAPGAGAARARRLARRAAAPRARRARAPAARRLVDDGRQRLGHARGRALRRRLRSGAGHRHDHGDARATRAQRSTGPRRRPARRLALPWPAAGSGDLVLAHAAAAGRGRPSRPAPPCR